MSKKQNDYASTSDFTGGAFANYGYNFLVGFVSLITLGIAYPFMFCIKKKWECKNTYIDGKQLVFDGTGGQLFGNYIKWTLLSIITLGIYLIIKGKVLMIEWETKHTHYLDTAPSETNLSHFDGKWYQILGVSWLTAFVTIITIGIGSYWAHCYTQRWYAKHTQYDGDVLCFDGKAGQYFGAKLKWTLLTIITFGIYAFWMAVKAKQWDIRHTHVAVPAAPVAAAPAVEAAPAAEEVAPASDDTPAAE